MKLNDECMTAGFDGTPRKLADGLYANEDGTRFFIEESVLFLPVDTLRPTVFFSRARLMRRVVDVCGCPWFFILAAEVAADSPDLANAINAICAKYQCKL